MANRILLDPADAWLFEAYSWRIIGAGYAATSVGIQNVYLHHAVMGQPINGLVIDHMNRNRLDNRRSNLAYSTRSANQLNSKRSDEAYLIQTTLSGKFQVQIQRDKVRRVSGSFVTIEEAEAERDKWLELLESGVPISALPRNKTPT